MVSTFFFKIWEKFIENNINTYKQFDKQTGRQIHKTVKLLTNQEQRIAVNQVIRYSDKYNGGADST